MILVVLSPVDIGISIHQRIVVWISVLGIKYLFLFVEWINHHHDEDEADLEEVK